jgi:hypothetical protein
LPSSRATGSRVQGSCLVMVLAPRSSSPVVRRAEAVRRRLGRRRLDRRNDHSSGLPPREHEVAGRLELVSPQLARMAATGRPRDRARTDRRSTSSAGREVMRLRGRSPWGEIGSMKTKSLPPTRIGSLGAKTRPRPRRFSANPIAGLLRIEVRRSARDMSSTHGRGATRRLRAELLSIQPREHQRRSGNSDSRLRRPQVP